MLAGKRELNSGAEGEHMSLTVVGLNLKKIRFGCVTCGHKFPLLQFRYTSHEMSAGVLSERRNKIGGPMKMTKKKQEARVGRSA